MTDPDHEALRTNVTATLAGFEMGALGFEEAADRILALVQPVDRDALAAAWDDGNAVGIDGWVGPGRGAEPDREAIRLRQQYLDTAFRRSSASTELETDPGQNKAARARLRDPAVTGPDAMVLPAATPRPRPSRTVEHSGAGRTTS